MRDDIRFDVPPRAEFADELEATLLQAIAQPIRSRVEPTRTDDEESIMTITDDRSNESTEQRSRRPALFAVAAAAALVAVALFWATSGGDDETAGTRDVTFVVVWSESDTVLECPSDVGEPVCAFQYDRSATSRFSGDLTGRAFQSVVWGDSEDFPDRAVRHEEKAATYLFRGTVDGCGTGDFLMIEALQNTSGPDRDFSIGTTTGSWEIVAGSGRGDLRSISGSGTSTGSVVQIGANGRNFTGSIECDPPNDLSAAEIIAPLGSYAVPDSPDAITPTAGALPDGVYRAEFSAEDLDLLEPDIVHDFTDGGAIELTLRGGEYSAQGFLPSGSKDGEVLRGIYQVDGDTVVWLQPDAIRIEGTDGINVFTWSIDGTTLTFEQVDGKHRDPWFAVPYSNIGEG